MTFLGVTMKVEAEDQNDRTLLRFDVADTGVGLSEEEISKVFQRFAQVQFLFLSSN